MARSSATTTRIEAIDPLADHRWDRFVEAHPRATVYHLGAWSRILEECYRCRSSYIAAEDDRGHLVGVLPLVYRRRLRQAHLGSLPFVRQAGPLAENVEQEVLLMRSATQLVRERKARLSIKTPADAHGHRMDELVSMPEEPSHVLSLDRDADALLGSLSGSLRRDITRGMRSVEVREGGSEPDLRRFYGLYLATMRMRGAAPRPWRQMELCWRLLRPARRLRLLLAEHHGSVVAGGIFHLLGDRVEARYVASDLRSRSLRPAHAVYWTMIEAAVAEGYARFDFGGGSGSLAWFKRRWGAEPVPLNRYALAPAEREQPPARSPRPEIPASDPPLAGLWRRMPLRLTPLAGRLVYRYRR